MIRLAEFVGLDAVPLPLDMPSAGRLLSSDCACIALSSRSLGAAPVKFLDSLSHRFSKIFVYGFSASHRDSELARALTRNAFSAVAAVAPDSSYEISADAGDCCGPFAGLSFGPANARNDCVFLPGISESKPRTLISIGGAPMMATLPFGSAVLTLLACNEVIDPAAETGPIPLPQYFSRFVPHVMALRVMAGPHCWLPVQPYASVVIDDPDLHQRYGFLRYSSLLEQLHRLPFHLSIAFIPYNYRATSPSIASLFRENPKLLSLCFHGNDHTGNELGSLDPGKLNALLATAQARMEEHRGTNQIPCDRVMVFPHCKFSLPAMSALQRHNFVASVNHGTSPMQDKTRISLGEYLEPAVLRYSGFPLFHRYYIHEMSAHEIAGQLFFGRPVLLGAHHDLFAHPDKLAAFVSLVNSLSPTIHWKRIEEVAAGTLLRKLNPDGSWRIRAFANTVLLRNDSSTPRHCRIQWPTMPGDLPIRVMHEGRRLVRNLELILLKDGMRPEIEFHLAPASQSRFTVIFGRGAASSAPIIGHSGWRIRLRRSLSTFRDNHLSRRPLLLRFARYLHRQFLWLVR